MKEQLSQALNDTTLRRLAGDRSYQRGCAYYQHGHVASISATADGVRAVVHGNQDYAVALTADDGVLDYTCDCPQGADGAFCKHCVAAALAWLNHDVTPKKTKSRSKVKELTLADVAKVLREEDKDTLLQMILAWAKDDDWLHERLLQYAARRLGPEIGIAAAGRAFERAVRIYDFVSYRAAGDWARGVDAAIDNIARLIEDGQPAAVVELCESALRKLVRASERIDDSDGYLSMLRDRLQEIHFRACQEARPDPVILARRLFEVELHSELDIFYGAAERYAKILGAKGLQEYRRLAEAEWEKVPVRMPKDERSDWGKHFRITTIMESLAKASGDVEQLVAVISRDLSHAYSYIRIAEVYREAGQHDQVLQWAEKGLNAFPERTDGRLREVAADEYHRRRRHEDAMKLMWAEFAERLSLGTYQTLERHARRSGAWAEWREQALAEVRRQIAKAKMQSRGLARSGWMPSNDDYSQLVEIFLYERDIDAAWREAQAGGCSRRLWLRLAAARETNHPADAAPIYLQQAELAVGETRNGRYDDAVELLIKAASVMKRMGQSTEFVRQLEALRVKYKIKRNFIKLVEQKRTSLYLS